MESLRLVFFVIFSLIFRNIYGQQSKYALIIGVKSYQFVSPLKNSLNDAYDMAAVLKQKGFQVVELFDPKTKREMQDGIRKYFALLHAQPNAAGLVFYSGHGMQVKGINYLIPTQADPQIEADLDDQCVNMDYVMRAIEQAGNGLNIFVLDACRNNPFRSFSRSGEKGLSMVDTPKGSYIVYATKPGSVASDGTGRNGLFTSKFLKHINTEGLGIEQVFKRVAHDVAAESNDLQRPWIASDYTGDFFFTPSSNTITYLPPQKTDESTNVNNSVKHEIQESKYDKKPDDEARSAQEFLTLAIKFYETEKNYPLAFENIQEVVRLLPDDTTMLLNAGVYFGPAAEEFDKSIPFIQRYLKKGGRNSDAYLQLISIYQDKKKDMDKALATIKEARVKFPKNTDFPKYELNIYLSQKKYDLAKKTIKGVLAKNPTEKESYYLLAQLHNELNNVDSAKMAYQKAVDIDPQYFEAQLDLAKMYLIDAKKTKSERDKLGITPNELTKRKELFVVLQKRYETALPYWERAEKIQPDNETVLYTLSEIYSALVMDDKADKVNKRIKALGLDN